MQPFARFAAVCVILLFGGILGCARETCQGPAPISNSEQEPKSLSIRLLDLDGRPFGLWPPQRSVVTVVLFTRTDCPISNRCAPEIRRLHEVYHPRGVEFYLVYVDPHETPDDIRRHLREYGYPCPALRDPEHTLVAHCNATTTPEAVVFDRDGAVTYMGRVDDLYADLGQPRPGATTHDLGDAIESTIAGQRVAHPRTTAVGCTIADLKD